MTDIRSSFQFTNIPWESKPAEWIKAQPTPTSAADSHFAHQFLDALNRFEEKRLPSSQDGYIRLFRRRASLEHDPSPHVPDTDIGTTEFAFYYSLLMAYRLLDVVSARESPPSDWEKESFCDKHIELPELNLKKKFGNWVHQLSDFRKQLKAHAGTKVPDFDQNTATQYLGEYVSRSTTNDAISRVMLNISTAAFHLNYLFKGHIDFATVEDVLSVLEPGSCNGIKQVPVGNFKNPLHVALSLSPILLFVQVTIQSKSMGRPRLMEAWRVVGRQKPRDIRRAEGMVWGMLFRIAGGECTVEEGVTTCLERIFGSDPVETPWHAWFIQPEAPRPQESSAIRPPTQPVEPLSPISPVNLLPRRTNLQDIETPVRSKSTPQTVLPTSLSQALFASNQTVAFQANPPPLTSPEAAEQERRERFSTRPPSPPPSPPRSPDVDMDEPDVVMDEPDVDMDEPEEDRPGSSNQQQTRRRTPHFTTTEEEEDEEEEDEEEEDEEEEDEEEEDEEDADEEDGREAPVNETNEMDKDRRPEQPQKRKPTSTKGAKGSLKAKLESKSKGKQVHRRRDADGEDDDGAHEPPRKKIRTRTPGPPSDLDAPSGSGIFPKSLNPVKVPPGLSTSTRESSVFTDKAFQPIYPRQARSENLSFKNALNEAVSIQLPFHTVSQKERFEHTWNSTTVVQKGLPLYLSEDPSTKSSSCVHVMTRENFLRESQLLPVYFQQRHIVVTGQDFRQYKFDATCLRTIFPGAKTPIPTFWFEDQSPIGGDCDLDPTANTMISAHQYQQESNNGKIVWCHTAKIDAIPPESTLSTDIYSDRTSFGLSGLEFYRSAYLRWGEASTTAAYLSWDRSQCAGHFERVVCGSRLFFVSRPKREDNTQFLYDPAIISTHESNDIVSQHWDIEAVIVPAGSDIYIRPFTPYASVSLESSVSHGAYFIPCAMIERVIVGLYQSWANTGEQYSYHVGIEHASRAILFTWRDKFVSDTIDQNEHIPDLETPEGVRQLFCLCGYRELVNICSQDSYESDDFSQGLSIHDRRGFIHGRQVSRGLLRWFFGNFALEGSQDSLKEVYFKYLAAVVKCMLGQQRKYGTGGITSERMEEFVSLTFGGSPEFMEPYQSNEVTPSYGGQLDGTIVRLPASDRLTNWHETHDDGATAEDRIWVAAQMKAMREKNDGV